MSKPEPVEKAASEVLAGDPRASARAWLWPLVVAVAIVFALDTYLVATRPLLPFDVPVAVFVQSFPWGPVTYVFDVINFTAGYLQVAVGAAAIIVLFIWERRAGYLMAIGSVSSLLDNLIKLAMARQRPSADLVHILTPAPGYSYPSGHAVFFTWLSFMVAFSLAPHVKPRNQWILWVAAALVILLACLARVWAGDHWPSDVAGGFLLGLGWSAFVVWLPERWLPSPTWRWFRGGRRRATT
ncbi:MAG: phosphatase PAP2 family protein [Chloroflexi bacterium]|nr:MAG: phosphatase PAP2 family protein [Chloroflexota bacterium]